MSIKHHCYSCFQRFGYEFEEIHKWMDEFRGRSHRNMRHDKIKTPIEAEKLFYERIPKQYRPFIKKAVLDHILLDELQVMEKSPSKMLMLEAEKTGDWSKVMEFQKKYHPAFQEE